MSVTFFVSGLDDYKTYVIYNTVHFFCFSMESGEFGKSDIAAISG